MCAPRFRFWAFNYTGVSRMLRATLGAVFCVISFCLAKRQLHHRREQIRSALGGSFTHNQIPSQEDKYMSASNSLRRAIRGALLSSATAAATVALPVHAQDSTITEVVVTGTRIVRPDYESASPVISIGNDAIR